MRSRVQNSKIQRLTCLFLKDFNSFSLKLISDRKLLWKCLRICLEVKTRDFSILSTRTKTVLRWTSILMLHSKAPRKRDEVTEPKVKMRWIHFDIKLAFARECYDHGVIDNDFGRMTDSGESLGESSFLQVTTKAKKLLQRKYLVATSSPDISSSWHQNKSSSQNPLSATPYRHLHTTKQGEDHCSDGDCLSDRFA